MRTRSNYDDIGVRGATSYKPLLIELCETMDKGSSKISTFRNIFRINSARINYKCRFEKNCLWDVFLYTKDNIIKPHHCAYRSLGPT